MLIIIIIIIVIIIIIIIIIIIMGYGGLLREIIEERVIGKPIWGRRC